MLATDKVRLTFDSIDTCAVRAGRADLHDLWADLASALDGAIAAGVLAV